MNIPTKPREYSSQELAQIDELEKFQDSYIFVYTNFKRKTEPIFALAFCEGQRKVSFDKNELLFKSDKEILDIISLNIKKHYKVSDGSIGIWGKIISYTWHHKDSKTYTFYPDGSFEQSCDYVEPRATLSINKKDLTKTIESIDAKK